MKVFRYVLWVVLLFMPLGCESIGSIRTIATSALLDHDKPGRYGITLGREDGFKHVDLRSILYDKSGPDRSRW